MTAALAMAAASTLADVIWALWIPTHRMTYGIVHGAALFLFLGLVLAALARRAYLPGALGGLLIGLLAAGLFYALRPLMGWMAMIAAWMALWILVSLLNRWVRASRQGMPAALVRGLVAAVLAGIGFYFAVQRVWGSSDTGWMMAAVYWTIAFLPGFLPLFLERRET